MYGGFSVDALQGRIEDSESKVVVTADGGFMNGKIVELKKTVDDAVRRCPTVETVIVVQRTGHEVRMEAGRDYWYHDLMKLPLADGRVPDRGDGGGRPALHPLHLRAPPGSRRRIIHAHGGYMVGIYSTLKYVFDIKDEDRWWCAADPGWVTGHSYIVYGPLLNGATTFMYEGAPTYPYPNRWWSLVEKYGITILYTAPTAIRGLMRFGESLAEPPRPLDAPAARLGGRAHQPRGVEVVPPRHRQGPLPDHGHLVADRDRHVHDHARSRPCRSSPAPARSPSSARRRRSSTTTGSRCRTARRASSS